MTSQIELFIALKKDKYYMFQLALPSTTYFHELKFNNGMIITTSYISPLGYPLDKILQKETPYLMGEYSLWVEIPYTENNPIFPLHDNDTILNTTTGTDIGHDYKREQVYRDTKQKVEVLNLSHQTSIDENKIYSIILSVTCSTDILSMFQFMTGFARQFGWDMNRILNSQVKPAPTYKPLSKIGEMLNINNNVITKTTEILDNNLVKLNENIKQLSNDIKNNFNICDNEPAPNSLIDRQIESEVTADLDIRSCCLRQIDEIENNRDDISKIKTQNRKILDDIENIHFLLNEFKVNIDIIMNNEFPFHDHYVPKSFLSIETDIKKIIDMLPQCSDSQMETCVTNHLDNTLPIIIETEIKTQIQPLINEINQKIISIKEKLDVELTRKISLILEDGRNISKKIENTDVALSSINLKMDNVLNENKSFSSKISNLSITSNKMDEAFNIGITKLDESIRQLSEINVNNITNMIISIKEELSKKLSNIESKLNEKDIENNIIDLNQQIKKIGDTIDKLSKIQIDTESSVKNLQVQLTDTTNQNKFINIKELHDLMDKQNRTTKSYATDKGDGIVNNFQLEIYKLKNNNEMLYKKLMEAENYIEMLEDMHS